MKDVEFYMSDLDATVNDEAKKYTDFDAIAKKAFQIKESLELSMQLYIMSSMMEVYYSQNQDDSYMQYLETDMTAYIEKCEKRMLGSFSVLNRRMVDYKGKPMEKIDKSSHMEKIGKLIDTPVSYTHLDVYKRQYYLQEHEFITFNYEGEVVY